MTAALLDTHAFLWFVFDDPRLSEKAARTIEDPRIEKLFGVVSLWEIAIKAQLDRLTLGMPTEEFFAEHVTGRELEILDLELSHLLAYDQLPLLHRDPFDRLLVAQAKVLGLPIVSADPQIARYDVEILW